jgi:hypothetical protein
MLHEPWMSDHVIIGHKEPYSIAEHGKMVHTLNADYIRMRKAIKAKKRAKPSLPNLF